MEITVKVNATAADEAEAAVTDVLVKLPEPVRRFARAAAVFPGLTTGRRAGLVTVRVNDQASAGDRDTILKALRASVRVASADLPKPRRAL